MQNLQAYMDQKNFFGQYFGHTYAFPLSQNDADELAKDLDCDLSPESLHCDGEITAAQARKKYKFYSKVYEELNAYCNLNRLTTPAVYEL